MIIKTKNSPGTFEKNLTIENRIYDLLKMLTDVGELHKNHDEI